MDTSMMLKSKSKLFRLRDSEGISRVIDKIIKKMPWDTCLRADLKIQVQFGRAVRPICNIVRLVVMNTV